MFRFLNNTCLFIAVNQTNVIIQSFIVNYLELYENDPIIQCADTTDITYHFYFQHPKKKQRVRLVEYWIETGLECFNIGNFNSLMAIIAGLNMSPISRLKKTVSTPTAD